MNSLGLTTAKDKLKAIQLLCYPNTLGALEYYLGLTDYLQSYVHFYAQLAESLQTLKITMLKAALLEEPQRRSFSLTTQLPPSTPRETARFSSLQDALSKLSMLVHHDPTRDLWLDLDTSKEFGFGAMLFHVR